MESSVQEKEMKHRDTSLWGAGTKNNFRFLAEVIFLSGFSHEQKVLGFDHIR